MSEESHSESELSTYEVEDRIIDSLKDRDGVATAGDVAADTGLPFAQVETRLREMLSTYKSHLDVDDDGNLRYRFDPSFTRRGEQPGRWWHKTKQALWSAFVWFFKVWTMVMLVGYTVIFVLLLIGLSIAALTAGEDEGGGEIGILPFYFLARILESIFLIDLYSRGSMGRRASRMRQKRKADKPDKAFYQKIFQYLFGPEQGESDPLATQKAFSQFIRSRDGHVTAAEWASRSGQSLEQADNALTAGIMRWQGDVDVSDDGTLVYRFDEMRRTADVSGDVSQEADPPEPIWNRKVKLPPLTGNESSTNTWITVFNGFNLVMSMFVLSAAQAGLALQIGLGWIPLVFSLMFFAIPGMRALRRSFRQQTVAKENERRHAIGTVFASASSGEAGPVAASTLPDQHEDGLLVDYEADVEVGEEGDTWYRFPLVAQQYEAAREARKQAEQQGMVFGNTVFSSDEEEKSLEESEMDDFDERLSRELGDDVTLGDLEEEVSIGQRESVSVAQ
jgi:hypothetical protein